MAEHPASERGGWGIRLHGGTMPHPSGSCLNCYSLGDVVAYDSEEEAEAAADQIRAAPIRLYERVTVERVAKGQRQPSIAEERHAIDLRAAYGRGVRDAARVCAEDAARLKRGADRYKGDDSKVYEVKVGQYRAERLSARILALLDKEGGGDRG